MSFSLSPIKKKSGFTLIELLTVIAIMSILTAIIYTSLNGSKAVSRDQQRISDISSIQIALELYYNQNHQYPPTLATLAVNHQFIASIPTAPNSGEIYGYFPLTYSQGSTICTSYQLWTIFEQSNANLSAKRGFDSVDLPTAGLYPCVDSNGIPLSSQSVNASTTPLVYDVMPNL